MSSTPKLHLDIGKLIVEMIQGNMTALRVPIQEAAVLKISVDDMTVNPDTVTVFVVFGDDTQKIVAKALTESFGSCRSPVDESLN